MAHPHRVRSVLEYSYADLAPEDALVCWRSSDLRANRVLIVDKDCEDYIRNAISAYVSQEEIMRSLVDSREERRTTAGNYVEVYLAMDCRPKISYKPYIEWFDTLSGK